MNNLSSLLLYAIPCVLRTLILEIFTDKVYIYIEVYIREVRANNFIIHGIEEKGEDLQDIKKSDSQIIKLFFEKVEAGAQPTHNIRLGKHIAKKKRPLKVLMKNKHEKDKVMSKGN